MLTIEELARSLNVSVMSVRRYIDKGKIKAIKIGNVWRINEDELKRILEHGC